METAKEIKVFGLDHFLSSRFKKIADEYFSVNKSLAIKRTIAGTVLQVLSVIAYYGAYILIILRTVKGVISLGDLTFLSGSFNRLQNQLQGILSTFTRITESALYLQDYYDFLAIKPTILDYPDAISVPQKITQGLRFERVGFNYPGTEEWLSLIHISFEDISQLAQECHFKDCTHTSEIKCAVKKAIEKGIIDENRYKSYLKLQREIEYLEADKDYLRMKEKKFKKIHKELKEIQKLK